ncbi:procathepsin L-like [Leguminivora glycinivorella]|uniref:procathepsin L-like n=1 Tax=Leguminivora glycinivorella TaxID=1035111 RepID=UPI00200DC1B5|nr:procathepsin L-like [Leguminivora glycinivorella]
MKIAVLLLIVLVASACAIAFQEVWKVLKVEYNTQYLAGDHPTHILDLKYVVNKKNLIPNKAQVQPSFPAVHENYDKRNLVSAVTARLQDPCLDKLPAYLNWTAKGAVTDVKDQYKGYCPSVGWAFSATGALEAQHFLRTGQLESLSEQHLLDCSYFYGNNSCAGGDVEWAFAFVAGHGGIATEEFYPYNAIPGQCGAVHDVTYSNVTVTGFVQAPTDEARLQRWVARYGPASVRVHSQLYSFQSYLGGVYYDKGCADADLELDHAMLLVGYGTEQPGGDYWLLKNSWGIGWGEDGYMKLARNRGNHCGIASRVIYPLPLLT